MTGPLRNYTRWVQITSPGGDRQLVADILGSHLPVVGANQSTGQALLDNYRLSPDEARLIGVRLIEGAALADGARAIRAAGSTDLHTDLHPQPGDEPAAPLPAGVDGFAPGGRS